MTITEFLLARIAEDEAAARVATQGRWTIEQNWLEAGVPDNSQTLHSEDGQHLGHIGDIYMHYDTYGANGEHIARWGPSRVLAESEAKARVVEEHPTSIYTDGQPGFSMEINDHACTGGGLCRTLRILALPYADHPDYDPAWRP